MAEKVTRIQLRRAAAQATFEANNPVLLAGEPAIALDTGILKIGDGVSTYNQLPEIGASPDLSNYVQKTDIVTSLSSSSTDEQCPSAKCVYDLVGDVESLLNNINSGS